MKAYRTAAFIFRRDLRLADNTALNAALAEAERVAAVFIFDDRQIEPHAYQSRPGLRFMFESLQDLREQLAARDGRLFAFRGEPERALHALHAGLGVEAVYVNRDYTPFSRERDSRLAAVCRDLGVAWHAQADVLLTEPEQVLNDHGQPYQVFTPFHRRARQFAPPAPRGLSPGSFVTEYLTYQEPAWPDSTWDGATFRGGRGAALRCLDALEHCRDYAAERDFPALAATSGLSAYLKFGCCSIREAYAAVENRFGPEHPLLRQFYWRDFFCHIGFHYPRVFGQAFQARFQQVAWRRDEAGFWAWAEGRTGFPIVDAAMRELNETGQMHNRLRMVTASFLTKDLHIDWRWGERYFAQRLVDYDPCLNNGNWQWAASTGCDAQPYFRVFNPWLQQRKFDPDCVYIKRWLPEARKYTVEDLHDWPRRCKPGAYPPPMLDHAERSRLIKDLFAAAARS